MADSPPDGPETSRRSIGLGTAAIVVSGSILLSRVLGLLRETTLAALLGVSAAGDLYRDAFVIPDLLNYLLAGGFLSITLIPLLARRIETGDEEGARSDLAIVFRWAALAILLLTVAMMVMAEPTARLLFPRLDEQAVGTVARLTRIALPAQVFFVLGALLMAYQYAHRRFLVPALAPVIYNLAIISGGLIGALDGKPSPDGFVWGAVVGAGIGSFSLQWLGARVIGLRSLVTRSSQGTASGVMRQYLLLSLPLMIGQSVTVLDEQFPRLFGQLAGEGGTAALSFARMLNMFPVGIIAQAAGVASFPFLARLVAGGRDDEANQTTVKALRATFAASVGAAALLFAAAGPLVRLVFQWGAFDADDTATVTQLLPLFALSIPAWGIHQVVARWFYAHRRMWLPVLLGTAATVLALPLTLVLFDRRGLEGIVIGSTVVMWAYTISLVISWRSRDLRPIISLLGPFTFSVVAGLAAGLSGRFLVNRLFDGSFEAALVAALAATVLVGAVFFGLGALLRVPEIDPRLWRNRK
jgi:putative peptidoglycan lipid II flippase